MMTPEQIDAHVDEMIAGTLRAMRGNDSTSSAQTIEMLDKVYRPFCKTAYGIGLKGWAKEIPLPKLFDAVVDLTVLQIFHTSNYITNVEQKDLKIQFINSFFIHMAERMNEFLEEVWPGEYLETLSLKDLIKKPGESQH